MRVWGGLWASGDAPSCVLARWFPSRGQGSGTSGVSGQPCVSWGPQALTLVGLCGPHWQVTSCIMGDHVFSPYLLFFFNF